MDVRSDEAASGTVEAVGFSILSAEEIRGMSVKKITKAELLDVKGTPVLDGLCDPAMGPTNDRDSCKSCGQLSLRCPGHCGHIDLARQVYNPVLFDTLCRLLKTMCMFCGKFKMKEEKVELYVQQLELVLKGHIGAARNLADSNSKEEDTHSDASHLKQKIWTSLQQTEATSIVEKFLKEKINQCQNCNKKNPKIKSPMPGMINMAMEGSDTRANVIGDSDFAELNELIRSSVVGEELRTFKAGEETLFSSNAQTTDASMKSMSKSKKSKSKNSLAHKLLSDTKMFSGELLPPKVLGFLEELWKNESKFCSLMCDIQQAKTRYSTKARSHAMFVMDALLVPPNKFRPTSMSLGGRALEHPQNVLLVQVLEANNNIINNNGSKEQKVRNWMKLQERVNVLFDSSKGFGKDKETTGLRQLLEKKAGILRQKMMGKRVNFACRSVISPDPYLAVNEIGIPPQFALKLTYPERVTPWNVNKLRQCIMNGPEIHPGASNYKDRESLYRLGNREARASLSKKLPTSRGTRGQVGNGPESEFEGKIVYRHLDHGDIVLANRQPTLHKISMMALVARVITGEKTLRMHYANCSSMNADFDGDEMNVHLPQDEVSRSEAINVVNANRQYVLPASGKPVRGLIQDHIVGSVLLTKKDTFLTRDEYHELLYSSVVPPILHGYGSSESTKKVLPIFADREIQPVIPSILKPVPLWTGKQVVTAVLNHVSEDRQPFTVKKAGKITKEYLEKQGKSFKSSKNCVQKSETVEQDKSFESSEGAAQKSEMFNHNEFEMLVYKNELLHGMIDKEQFGLYGLVHTVHELYGPNSAGILLSMFSRLFTVFLQMHGFTCGVDDLLIVSSSNDRRRELLETCEKKSEDTHLQFVGINGGNTDPLTLQAKIEEVLRNNGEAAITRLDRNMSSALNHITSLVNDDLVPGGLLKPFTRNCVSLMTATGAKGSSVNFNQISSLLGQQELEGKRVPRMVSGKTLPCFPAWDIAPRAGGFVSDRFLTGLRPQEYYFHCMAGREGLVDTAIKTSRSGYLQRCLVKNLESLKVCYDFTVRDVDGSVVQFVYGEDGIDVHQTSFLNQFEALASNSEVILEKLSNRDMGADLSTSNAYLNEIPPGLRKKAEDFHSKLTEAQRNLFQLRKRKKLMKIMQLKYLNSLVQPGEAVGVLASQSLGEQTTQMTLNTFHLAGRGDVNVTLGIPRLQEILMNAKENIKTPVMVCPLREGKTEKEAEALAAKLRRISVADIIESMEVCVVPFCVSGRKVATVFKLKMKLYPSELYPADSDITLESCHATLNGAFVGALDSAINKHLNKLSRIRGIKVSKKENNSIIEDNEDESGSKSNHEVENDDGSDDDEVAEDQGADAQKRKKQACDEIEYDDDIEDEKSTMVDDEQEDEGASAAGFESEVDNVGGDVDDTVDVAEDPLLSEEPETSSKLVGELNAEHGIQQESGANYEGPVYKQKKKKLERVIKVETRGLEFEVHFDFTDEPHILLAEIAQRTAKSVYVKQTTDIEHCTVNVVKGKGTVELKTAGVYFPAFWDLSDDLDINRISSNDIWAMLWTYGVEAARGTIIKEVNDVFKAYGIAVDIRHLFLIADFMTFDGDYRAMNRGAMTTYGTSPFGKITFETATKFAVEAAFSGEVDRLEAPSASICLGQPVKMGTGSFDLLQNL